MPDLLASLAASVAARLVARRETVAISESSTGGLISAALLSIPGASAYFMGGGVIYTQAARRGLLQVPDDAMRGIRSSTEAAARLMAAELGWDRAREQAAGPQIVPDRDLVFTEACLELVDPVLARLGQQALADLILADHAGQRGPHT